MDDDLKKFTFSMDKANGESRTVIVIGSKLQGDWSWIRTTFDQPITIRPDKTMRLIKEESLKNPGIVGVIPSSVIVDDFSELEERVRKYLDHPEITKDKFEEPLWKQIRPYGKKNRRKFK